jgi:putative SOS response-associated peptidase YedK
MCGRFVTAYSLEELIEEVEAIAESIPVKLGFDAEDLPLFSNYNVAPTHALPVVTMQKGELLIDVMQWGLVPVWSKDPSVGSKMINARSETLTEKPSFRRLVRSNSCLVPMNGFYEWDRTDSRHKVPYFVPRTDGALMLCAGLWNASPALDGINTFTMITKPSVAPLANIHDRSPVQFSRDVGLEWLSDDKNALSLMSDVNQPLFSPYQVSTDVNSVRNNFAELLDKVEPEPREPDTLF